MTLDPARLDALERTIGRLTQELAEARYALAALRANLPPADPARGASAVPPANPAPAAAASPPAPRDGRDGLENLIGRYGVLALAVLTIVMGAGALVSWAVSHGLLGPWVRVSLGALLAIVIAGTGWWLRRRSSRGFGNVLLALSLAVVLVVAWGAGPRLALVSPRVSLGVAVGAAVALVALALAEDEQLLFVVGLGGALLAPFAMATGVPQHGVLAAYGLILLAAAIRTIGARAWWQATGLVIVGTAVYAVAVGGYRSGVPWVDREFNALFAGAIGLIALLWERKPSRPWIALAALAAMALTGPRPGPGALTPLGALRATPDIQLVALAGAVFFLLAARSLDEREHAPFWMLAVVIVPAVFLEAALRALGATDGAVAGSVVLAWGLAYSVVALLERGTRRGVLLTVCALAGLWAITLLLDSRPQLMPVVVAAYAVLLALVSKQERQPDLLLATGAALLTAFWSPAVNLAARAGFATPFLSADSLGAASAAGAAWLAARYGIPGRVLLFGRELERDHAAALSASVLAFVWGWLELRLAFSADVSTFLLIAYFATCGVLAIQQGHSRNAGSLRQVGLALSVLAALYALAAASGVQAIGLRVASYLLVGMFLLGVAWWYRGERRSARAGQA